MTGPAGPDTSPAAPVNGHDPVTAPTGRHAGSTAPVDGDVVAAVLEEIKHELVGLLGDGLVPDAIRIDVDVFEATEPVIVDRWLDSMDLVQIMAALEDRFGVRLATVLTGDEPMTLTNVARHIARTRP